jgi:putative transposase
VVGWTLADTESQHLAERLLAESIAKHELDPAQLTIHSDNGASMGSKVVAQLLADLGVTKTHSRPHVSNDNPYSEAQFKTLKYRPTFPDRFGSIEDARSFCRRFFDWYHTEHYHSGIAWHHPADIHYGRAEVVQTVRAEVLAAAYERHPERFVRKHPEPRALPEAAWISKPPAPDQRQDGDTAHSTNP